MAVAHAYAYDFDTTEQNVSSAVPKVKQPPELHVVESRAVRTRAFYRKAIAVFLLVMGLFSATLYNRMILTELTAQVESAQNQYDTLVSENRRMQVELESKVSLRSIEQAAQALGMSRVESYQIEYVDLGEGDRVVVTQDDAGLFESAAASVRGLFDRVLEYLGW
jgi:cell division protein FtsL